MMASSSTSTVNGIGSLLEHITSLDIDDIEDLQAYAGSSHVDEELTDEELARFLFAQEAQSLLNISRDFNPASSNEERSLLEELIVMEELARFDHEMALAIAEGRPLPTRAGGAGNSQAVNDQRLSLDEPTVQPPTSEDAESLTSSRVSTPSDSPNEQSLELPVLSPLEDYTPAIPLVECIICGDRIVHTIVTMPCGHYIDKGCLHIMVRKASEDESLFPPRCCEHELPLADIKEYLDDDLADLFEIKSVEYRTKDRVYCHLSSCSRFLAAATDSPSSIECQVCLTPTCGACKEQAHVGRPCDKHVNSEVLELAQKEGWQRCYSCRHLIELTRGCFHIICVCKAQFCYSCATPWKECSCPQFAEERL